MPPESTTPRSLLVAASVLLISILGFVDHVTGYELNFFVFYFVPVALLAWYVGRAAALAAATACALVWYGVDAISGHSYGVPATAIWNGALRWIAFAMVAITLSRIRRDELKQHELNRRLNTTVEQLQESLAQIAALRNDVQIVCAWTNRIKSEGRWIKFEDFMAHHFQLRFTHGISAEGVKQLEAEEERARAERKTAGFAEPGEPAGRSE